MDKPLQRHRKGSSSNREAGRRLGMLAVVVLGIAGTAQAAWLVYDERVETAVKDVKQEVHEFRADVRPAWNKGGNNGAYNPYNGRKKDYDLPDGDTITREETYGMEARCGQTRTFSGDELWKLPELPAKGSEATNLADLNTEVCQRLVAAENRRFKAIMGMVSRIRQRNEALKQLAGNRASVGEKGELDVSSNNLEMSIADAQVEIQYQQSTIAAYDSLIATLKDSQNSVADRTMNGKNTAMADGVRMIALEAALQGVTLF